jgi:Ca2+/Na+ antiporter
MKNIMKSKFWNLAILSAAALALRFYVGGFLSQEYAWWVRMLAALVILAAGALFVLKGVAEIIEETTGVLSARTKLAGGLLQSLGTAFPDMVLGIVAAIISLGLVKENYALAINYAIIAAATTFGSNIYNIGYAIWCVFRQNLSNKKARTIAMIPGFKKAGMVTPMKDHKKKPQLAEIDTALDILNVLTLLTAVVALSMVLFGQVHNPPANISGDLYKMIKPVGLAIFALCVATLFYFRKTRREERGSVVSELGEGEKYYHKQPTWVILLYLAVSGVVILFAAEVMVRAVEAFCSITGTPFVVAGVLAGLIGCIGEMIVLHNFTVNPKGRIGDALVGVGMDNIVTTMGASIVAIMGGIFLGGNSLILIFIIILAGNTFLIWQISKLKNYFLQPKR